MKSQLLLFNPEWQGYGENNNVYYSSIKVAEMLFGDSDVMKVEVPVEESLERKKGVLGFDSIVSRFQTTINELRQKSPEKYLWWRNMRN